jgi:integrase
MMNDAHPHCLGGREVSGNIINEHAVVRLNVEQVKHRTTAEHRCDEHEGKPCSSPDASCRACRRRCQPHRCRPLGATAIRQIHFLLHGAYKRAVRWKWVAVNPIADAEPPQPPPPNPHPTTVEETARIINEAWSDPDWGAFIWLAVACGGRRAELCALQWRAVDLDRAVITLERAVAKDGKGRWYLKDTKTHQQRRVALDPLTISVLAAQWERYKERCVALGVPTRDNAFVFSLAPDHSTFLIPESVSQRFSRLVDRLSIDTSIHALRHYNATELIAAGVDVRTVAGRLGHGGGGITTLRIYAAFREEADQRAAVALSPRMPAVPDPPPAPVERAKTDPRSPYERIAAALRERILGGELAEGGPLPSIAEIAQSNGVSVGTAHRSVALLKTWGLVEVTSDRRAVVMSSA